MFTQIPAWGGSGPSVYIYNHATLFWDLVASDVGHGTDVQKSYSVSTSYISSSGGVNVKLANSFGAKITWVKVTWSIPDPEPELYLVVTGIEDCEVGEEITFTVMVIDEITQSAYPYYQGTIAFASSDPAAVLPDD